LFRSCVFRQRGGQIRRWEQLTGHWIHRKGRQLCFCSVPRDTTWGQAGGSGQIRISLPQIVG
jgi:hypothetical protein